MFDEQQGENQRGEKIWRKKADLAPHELESIVNAPQDEVTKLSESMGVKPSYAYHLRYEDRKKRGLAKPKKKYRKRGYQNQEQMKVEAKPERSFTVQVGNITVDVVYESHARVSGLIVKEEAITLKIK